MELGSFIAYMNATDPDKGTSGEVLFNFEERTKNTDWKCFNLDSKTGMLTLNTNLNQAKQSVYMVDIIASDLGKPTPLTSKMTLTILVVDESDNAALFNRMQICLSSGAGSSAVAPGQIACEKDYKSLIVHLREEDEAQQVQLNLAKIIDVNRQDDEICYYLQGPDKDDFSMDKHSGLFRPRFKLNRERRDKYELYLRASEYCFCDRLDEEDRLVRDHCKEMVAEVDYLKQNVASKKDENYTNLFELSDDVSRLKLTVVVDDINDNVPKFNKKLYRVGITSDIAFGEIILESFVSDQYSALFKLWQSRKRFLVFSSRLRIWTRQAYSISASCRVRFSSTTTLTSTNSSVVKRPGQLQTCFHFFSSTSRPRPSATWAPTMSTSRTRTFSIAEWSTGDS